MVRALAFLGAGCAALLTAAPARADVTPEGPASFMNRWTGVTVGVLTPPSVLMKARVTVSAGGRAGTVRVQGMSELRDAGFEPPRVGPPVALLAAPGTYTLPAPRVLMGEYFGSRIGLVQETGSHAIVETRPCTPEQGPFGDFCQTMWLDGWPGGSRGGARLTIEPVTEPDLDRDLRGDRTEDRTDLRLRATTSRAADGRLRTKVVVSNRGPLSADLPVLETGGRRTDRRWVATDRRPGWRSGCQEPSPWERSRKMVCALSPLAAGESRTLIYLSKRPAKIVARAEGPDLVRADNVLP